MPSPSAFVYRHEEAALARLFALAHQGDRRSTPVADFLLAWWDAGVCGGFDFTALWDVDQAVVQDIFTVIGLIAREKVTPANLGFTKEFDDIVARWRPGLRGGSRSPSGIVPKPRNAGADRAPVAFKRKRS